MATAGTKDKTRMTGRAHGLEEDFRREAARVKKLLFWTNARAASSDACWAMAVPPWANSCAMAKPPAAAFHPMAPPPTAR
jgi:hypothetical protein